MLKFSKISIKNTIELKKFITSDSSPKFFIHFSFIKRFGINIKSTFNTPLGFYAYPLTKNIYDQLIHDMIPYAKDRPYILVFSIQNNLLNLDSYTQNDLEKDILRLKYLSKIPSETFNKIVSNACKFARHQNPAGKFWNITRKCSYEDPKEWRKIFMLLGYDGVYDNGKGIIHPSEPLQSVIFEQSILIPIDIIINPNNKYKFDENVGIQKHERHLIERANDDEKILYNHNFKNNKNKSYKFDKNNLNVNNLIDYILYNQDLFDINFEHCLAKLNITPKDFLNLIESDSDRDSIIFFMYHNIQNFDFNLLSDDQIDRYINYNITYAIKNYHFNDLFLFEEIANLLIKPKWNFYLKILMKSNFVKHTPSIKKELSVNQDVIDKILYAYENKKSQLTMSDIIKLKPLDDLCFANKKDLDKITDIIDDNVAEYLEKTYNIFLP